MTANSSKELPFVVRQQDFEKMSLTLADGEFRDKKILIYYRSIHKFLFCVLFLVEF